MSEENSRVRDGTPNIMQPNHTDMLHKIMDTINIMLQYLHTGLDNKSVETYHAKAIVRMIERLLRIYRLELTHQPGPHSRQIDNAVMIERWLARTKEIMNRTDWE